MEDVLVSSPPNLQVFVGGDSGSGEFSEGDTSGLQSWANTVADNPVPVSYVLVEYVHTADRDRELTDCAQSA